jgi:hypothetical protein
MSELGSGSGTSYPGALDTDNVLEVNSPNAGKTKARAETINDANAAIVAIQTELGTDPAGTLATVKAFLQTQHAADGTHNTLNQNTTGNATTATTATQVTDGTNSIKIKVIDIGDWNMDSASDKTVAHGIASGASKIKSVSVLIRPDIGSAFDGQLVTLENSLVTGGGAAIVNYGAITGISDTDIALYRTPDLAAFDSNVFDATSFNRGWITITYVV